MNWASVCRAGPEHVQSVHAGQVQVEQDQVVELGVQLTEALLAGPDCLYTVSVLGQDREKEFANILLVLYDQDSWRDVALRLVIPH